MADWKEVVRGRGLAIPDEQVERIAPVLDALEKSFRDIANELPNELGMAVDFRGEQK
jgi:hypothetical protein